MIVRVITCLLLVLVAGCGKSFQPGELVVVRGIEGKPWIIAKSVADVEQVARALSSSTPTAMPAESFEIPYPVEATVKSQSGRYVELRCTTYEAFDITGFVDSAKVTIKPADASETVTAKFEREKIIEEQSAKKKGT